MVWQLLKTLNMELPHDLVIPFLGIYPRKVKSIIYFNLKICKNYYNLLYINLKTCTQMLQHDS